MSDRQGHLYMSVKSNQPSVLSMNITTVIQAMWFRKRCMIHALFIKSYARYDCSFFSLLLRNWHLILAVFHVSISRCLSVYVYVCILLCVSFRMGAWIVLTSVCSFLYNCGLSLYGYLCMCDCASMCLSLHGGTSVNCTTLVYVNTVQFVCISLSLSICVCTSAIAYVCLHVFVSFCRYVWACGATARVFRGIHLSRSEGD